MVWKINALREYNPVGIVIAVLSGLITAVVFYSKTPNPDFKGQMMPLCLACWALALFLLLMRSNIEIDLARQVIRTGKGLWPVVAWKEIPFSGPLLVTIDATRGRYINYTGTLTYNGDRTVNLLAGGGETGLESLVDLIEGIGAQIQAGPGFEELAPNRIKRRLAER